MDIRIGNRKYTASCLTDVPIDLIDGALVMLRERLPFIFEIDTDGDGHYTFINSRLQRGLLVTDGFDLEFYDYLEPIDLGEYIHKYLSENLEVIGTWFSFETEEEELQKYKENLVLKLEELRNAIEEEKKVS